MVIQFHAQTGILKFRELGSTVGNWAFWLIFCSSGDLGTRSAASYLAIVMPLIDCQFQGCYWFDLPFLGGIAAGKVENTFHFKGKEVPYYFPNERKCFSCFMFQEGLKGWINAEIRCGKLIPLDVPEFGTRLAKGRAGVKDSPWQLVIPFNSQKDRRGRRA